MNWVCGLDNFLLYHNSTENTLKNPQKIHAYKFKSNFLAISSKNAVLSFAALLRLQ